ncbi:MAG: Ureidoglycolate hydrolase [Cyanobacteria bacterium SW_9_44_58]|nr:MAG: Ureidoglycolate hydrolase [Cyanobacteria bacterium SW_9_44_58]
MAQATRQTLSAEWVTKSAFTPYGDLVLPSKDGKSYDETDAQLDLSQGQPHFYIMQLKQRGKEFHRIARHQLCTQCLGSLEGKTWLLAVAPPNNNSAPNIAQLKAFQIPGNCFIKLHKGTWHAGPYFDDDVINFYNLELIDTNEVDHFSYDFLEQDNVIWEIMTAD